ncbi:MAG: DUF1080 domain-containing protein [Planctomycetes bacterium]|nr:DUF1080 domain-containing protein [Planctomycetota bacterium]
MLRRCLLVLTLAACGTEPASRAPSPADREVAQRAPSSAEREPAPRALFDGRSLTGWDGDPRYWSVENGAIVGRSTEANPLLATTYLVWRGGEVGDFELAFDFKITGGNSGLQFRSRDQGGWQVAGYQADIEDGPNWTGCLYEQDGRGVAATRGEDVRFTSAGRTSTRFANGAELLKVVRVHDWNHYVVRARGRTLELEVNGARMLRCVDEDPRHFAPRGILAFQLHQGPPMQVEFRSVVLKELPPEPDAAPSAETGPKPRAERVPQWIWSRSEAREHDVAAFRRAFELRAAPTRAHLRGTFDNHARVFVNGALVATDDEWESPIDVDVADHLHAGANELALVAKNDGGPAGVWCELVVDGERGRLLRLVTDASWSASTLADVAAYDAWTPSAFDARAAGSAHAEHELGQGDWGTTGLAGDLAALAGAAAATTNAPEPVEERAASGDTLTLPEGFRAELLYSVPKAREGSWVSLCTDDRGRLYASDQDGSIYRITPPPIARDATDASSKTDTNARAANGAAANTTLVERVPVELGHAHGLLWAFDALYVVVGETKPHTPGLYRVRDTDGDDVLDHVELLRALGGSGEHGPHAVVLDPSGRWLWLIAGNFTKVPELAASRVPATWGEDELLPHLGDPNGHDPHIQAPGGWVCRTDEDGKEFELFAVGLRNCYDLAFGPEGELFTYDSDMEWDIGAPWYRPTRVLHLVSGADYGWRNGSAKWNADWPDTLPSVFDLGAGSPTGVLYGKDLRFPERYRNALFCADWAYGKVHCVTLSPRGSSFGGTSEVFVSGKPFPVTDLVAGKDGALYVTTGGRQAQSGLYRITWDGAEKRAAPAIDPADAEQASLAASARNVREFLEPLHKLSTIRTEAPTPSAQEKQWLATAMERREDSDPFLRQAARVAIERSVDPSLVGPLAAGPSGLIARLHVAGPAAREPALAAFEAVHLERATTAEAIDWLRVLQLVLLRAGPVELATRERIAQRLLPVLAGIALDATPTATDAPTETTTLDPRTNLRRELVRVIAALDVEAGLEPVLVDLERAATQEDAIHAAHALLAQHAGWTVERERRALVAIDAWRAKAKGGHSLLEFVDAIRERLVKNFSDADRTALGALAEAPKTADATPAPAPAPKVRAWTRAELEAVLRVDASTASDAARSTKPSSGVGAGSTSSSSAASSNSTSTLDLGRAAFTKARCATCHRIEGAGGATGPDLTGVGRRFSRGDLLDSLLEPSKVISDQFRDVELVTNDGELYVGRIEREDATTLVLRRLPPFEDLIEVAKSDLEERRPSALSRMPSNLLDVLDEDEVRALVAHLLER